jgi:C-terminal processing protease CtpA/Prc
MHLYARRRREAPMKSRTIRALALAASVMSLLLPAWGQKNPDEQAIKNLRAFAKLYGYIRYFHPSDEAAQIDWEKFAIYGAEKIKRARDSRQLKVILEELFLPIAPTAEIYLNGEAPNSLSAPLPKNTAGLKVVAWQHRGVGFGSVNSPYASIRVNKENVLKASMMAGTISQGIDAAAYRGQEIRLRGSVRVDGKESQRRGYLWLRVDRPNNRAGFFNAMRDQPIRSSQWKEYEIRGVVDRDALFIVFGGILENGERMALDDFELLAKDKKGRWKPVVIQNPGFEEGEPEKAPAGWTALSRGYLYKISLQNPAKGKQCLVIEPPTLKLSEKLFEKIPAIGETIHKTLAVDLACSIPLALYSDDKETLGKNERYPFQKWTKALAAKKIEDWSAGNEFVRLGDVIIAWNVFQHFFPYFDVVGVNWDAELALSLQKALGDKTEKDFFNTLNLMVAHLRDGHGSVYSATLPAQAGLPIAVEWVENEVVVTARRDPVRLQRGDIIVAIDGIRAEQALINAEEAISGSPQWKRTKALSLFGAGDEGTTAELGVKRGGKILSIDIQRNWKQPVFEAKGPPIYNFPEGIVYVDLDRAAWDVINLRLKDLAAAKGIVFDLRGYPRGNQEILCYLLKARDTSGAWMQIPQFIYPDRENIAGFQKMGWFLDSREPKIKGKVAFITDGRAISYAESVLSFVEHYKLGEIVGQPTAGTNGNVNSFEVPGGFRIAWTGMKVVKHDGSQHHLIGIRPTVPMKRTIKGILEGRDELLEKALEVVRKKVRP